MPATLTILGSTGSIGLSTLRVVDSLDGEYAVYGLACRSNITALEGQIRGYAPRAVAVSADGPETDRAVDALRAKFPDVEFLRGDDGVAELASRPVDVVVSAIVGAAGLRPTLAALGGARRIALANKETLVMAGTLFMDEVAARGVELVPVDSEHSAIFALLASMPRDSLERIILTASGGGLRDHPLDGLSSVTPEEALAHPTWDMGSKITIDSATLFNKGLEVIEAHFLFGVEYERIDVVVHPESIIHSMVELVDGSIHAHLGVADMALPILGSLVHPALRRNPFGRLDLARLGRLSFLPVDSGRYPALALCYAAGRRAGTLPAVLNAANEVAVQAFLHRRIRFTDIARIVERTMEDHSPVDRPDLHAVFSADGWARERADEITRSMKW